MQRSKCWAELKAACIYYSLFTRQSSSYSHLVCIDVLISKHHIWCYNYCRLLENNLESKRFQRKFGMVLLFKLLTLFSSLTEKLFAICIRRFSWCSHYTV